MWHKVGSCLVHNRSSSSDLGQCLAWVCPSPATNNAYKSVVSQCRSQNAANGYAHPRETNGSRSYSLQLRYFLKWELLLKERKFFPLRAVPYGLENNFYHIRWPNTLSLVSFAGMTLDKCIVLRIGTLTGWPLCRESHPLCRLKNPTVI